MVKRFTRRKARQWRQFLGPSKTTARTNSAWDCIGARRARRRAQRTVVRRSGHPTLHRPKRSKRDLSFRRPAGPFGPAQSRITRAKAEAEKATRAVPALGRRRGSQLCRRTSRLHVVQGRRFRHKVVVSVISLMHGLSAVPRRLRVVLHRFESRGRVGLKPRLPSRLDVSRLGRGCSAQKWYSEMI